MIASAGETIHLTGTFHVPEGALYPQYIMPDEVVVTMAERHGLLLPNMRGIDPICGTGTFSRVINQHGGCCDAIERDPHHAAIARREVGPGRVPLDNGYTGPPDASLPGSPYGKFALAGEVLLGDCTTFDVSRLPSRTKEGMFYPYHYIYTSIPFALITNPDLDPTIAAAFDRLLMPSGIIIIDSAIVAERAGATCYPAQATAAYFRRNGFELRDAVTFRAHPPEGCDAEFTELVFRRRGDL